MRASERARQESTSLFISALLVRRSSLWKRISPVSMAVMRTTAIHLLIQWKVKYVELPPIHDLAKNDRSAATEGAESLFRQNVSTPTRLHFCKRIRMLALLGVCMAPCLMSYAQTQAHADYPQTRGGVEQWKQEDIPSWLSLDGQIRLRTEDFTSYQYTSGNDRIYELTRVCGGLTVRLFFYFTDILRSSLTRCAR